MHLLHIKILVLFLLLFLVSCDGNSDDSSKQLGLATDSTQLPVSSGIWYRPTPNVSWQWQLQGTLNTSYNVAIYDIDLFDTSTDQILRLQNASKKVICYFSAGSYESFRADSNRFLETDLGSPLDGFADEKWLDIRSGNVKSIMLRRLDLAVTKGCDGVEPDNMDGYANDSGFPLTAEDQLTFNRFIANEAHRRGLAVGLKNDLDQIPELVEYFDFAVNEQCFEFDECNELSPFINSGKAVLNAEYLKLYVINTNSRNRLCSSAISQQLSSLILPIELDDSYRDSCNKYKTN